MGNAFVMLLILGVALTALCLVFKRQFLYLFGADDATYKYADEYLSVYVFGTTAVMISLGMNPFINTQGFGRTGMLTIALGAVVNIVLDPIFIFALGMGVRGAALASVMAQACSAVWVLMFLTGKKALLSLHSRNMRLKLKTIGRIAALGVSGFIMNLTNSLVQIVCNKTLLVYGGNLYVSIMTVINAIGRLRHSAYTGLLWEAYRCSVIITGRRNSGESGRGSAFSSSPG